MKNKVKFLIFILPFICNFIHSYTNIDFYRAIVDGDKSKVLELIKTGIDVNEQLKFVSFSINFSRRPVYTAITNNRREITEILLDNGAKLYDDDNLCDLAIRYGHTWLLKIAMKKGFNINTKDRWDDTALMNSAKYGNSEMTRLLLNSGADIYNVNKNGSNLLHAACDGGLLWLVEYLVNKKFDINAKNNFNITPFLLAVNKGHTDIVNYLLKKNVDKDIINENGESIAEYACRGGFLSLVEERINSKKYDNINDLLYLSVLYGHRDVSEFLINNGADITYTDIKGNTILKAACISGSEWILEELIRKKIDIKKNNKIYALMHLAANNGRLGILKILQKNGINIDTKNEDGETPFFTLSSTLFNRDDNPVEIADYLLENGADIDTKSNLSFRKGYTPLTYAIRNGNYQLAEYLINKGANVNYESGEYWYKGMTPIFMAIDQYDLNLAKLLINNGADINGTFRGHTCLTMACEKNDLEMVKLLVENNAKVNQKSAPENEELTPLHFAAGNNNLQMVKYLLEHDANPDVVDSELNFPVDLTDKEDIKDMIRKYSVNQSELKEKVELTKKIFTAVSAGNAKTVEEILNDGFDINSMDESGKTLLISSIENNKKNIFDLLLSKGVDINIPDRYQKYPVLYAVKCGNMDFIKTLVEMKADLNATDRNDNTPLIISLLEGNTKIADFLIDQNINPDLGKKSEGPALHLAIRLGYEQIAKRLLEKNPDVNLTDLEGLTALHWASIGGKTEIVQLLIKKGANINSKVSKSGSTPLHFASKYGHLDTVELLVNNKAWINTQMNKYNVLHPTVLELLSIHGAESNMTPLDSQSTPLQLAIMRNHLDIIKYLIDHGANANIKNGYGQTSLNLAKSKEAYDLLINAGAKKSSSEKEDIILAINRCDSDHLRFILSQFSDINFMTEKTGFLNEKITETPLHMACYYNYYDIVKLLIDNKADMNIQNSAGDTPLHKALSGYNIDNRIIKYLVKNGADVTIKNNKGLSPIDMAKDDIVRSLLKLYIKDNKQN